MNTHAIEQLAGTEGRDQNSTFQPVTSDVIVEYGWHRKGSTLQMHPAERGALLNVPSVKGVDVSDIPKTDLARLVPSGVTYNLTRQNSDFAFALSYFLAQNDIEGALSLVRNLYNLGVRYEGEENRGYMHLFNRIVCGYRKNDEQYSIAEYCMSTVAATCYMNNYRGIPGGPELANVKRHHFDMSATTTNNTTQNYVVFSEDIPPKQWAVLADRGLIFPRRASIYIISSRANDACAACARYAPHLYAWQYGLAMPSSYGPSRSDSD